MSIRVVSGVAWSVREELPSDRVRIGVTELVRETIFGAAVLPRRASRLGCGDGPRRIGTAVRSRWAASAVRRGILVARLLRPAVPSNWHMDLPSAHVLKEVVSLFPGRRL